MIRHVITASVALCAGVFIGIIVAEVANRRNIAAPQNKTDNVRAAPPANIAEDRAQQKRDDDAYSFTSLLWVSHQPLEAIERNDALLASYGLGSEIKGEPPVIYRTIEGEALGIGQGNFPRFRYLPSLFMRREEIVERLRETYPHLIVVDESNGASGELHVGRLRKGLSVAIFGGWYNPWSIVVASTTDQDTHPPEEFSQWASLCEWLGSGAIEIDWIRRSSRAKDERKIDDADTQYSVWAMRPEESDRAWGELLVFSVTSLHAPVRLGLREE